MDWIPGPMENLHVSQIWCFIHSKYLKFYVKVLTIFLELEESKLELRLLYQSVKITNTIVHMNIIQAIGWTHHPKNTSGHISKKTVSVEYLVYSN